MPVATRRADRTCIHPEHPLCLVHPQCCFLMLRASLSDIALSLSIAETGHPQSAGRCGVAAVGGNGYLFVCQLTTGIDIPQLDHGSSWTERIARCNTPAIP